MTDALAATECAIYAVLFIPVVFHIVRHGRHGLLGWLFLSLFCILRIIGSGMSVNDSSHAASTISNVGLSPILLATAGILHEARTYRIHNADQKLEWSFALFYHMPVVVGVALTAAGSVKLQHHEQPIEKSEKLVKAGISILTVTWAIVVGRTGFSFRAPRATNADRARVGTVLLWSIAFSLVFIGVRVFYSLVALCTQEPYLNPATGSLAIRVVLSFLPQLIATIAYVVASFMTQAGTKLVHQDGVDYESLPKSHPAPCV